MSFSNTHEAEGEGGRRGLTASTKSDQGAHQPIWGSSPLLSSFFSFSLADRCETIGRYPVAGRARSGLQTISVPEEKSPRPTESSGALKTP